MYSSVDAIGLDIAKMFYSTMDSIVTRGEDLSRKIETLTKADANGQTSSISNEQMLIVQFEIGQYNAMVEMLSSLSKSLTDMMKTLAQRSS